VDPLRVATVLQKVKHGDFPLFRRSTFLLVSLDLCLVQYLELLWANLAIVAAQHDRSPHGRLLDVGEVELGVFQRSK